jgi:Tfp pilus assembly protein PilF
MEHVGDFAPGRFNLGNMYMNLGKKDLAEKHFKASIKIDKLFYPAKMNLAMLFNSQGKNNEAESLFREVAKEHPEFYEASYSLGLLLAEKKEYLEAARYLEKAAKGMQNRGRVHYNLGLLLQILGRFKEAETSLLRALEIEPDSMNFLHALADHYIKTRKFHEAKTIAEQMISKHPSDKLGPEMLKYINRVLEKKKRM